MSQTSPRKRLCQVVLGSELKMGQRNSAVVSLPVLHEDIDGDVLFAAQEAIYSYTPAHVRQVLPFALHAIEEQKQDIIHSGFIDSFLLRVSYEFYKDDQHGSIQIVDGDVRENIRFRTDYSENWTAETISALRRHELGWAYEWTCELLNGETPNSSPYTRQNLTMLARILGMALGKKVTDVPAFEG